MGRFKDLEIPEKEIEENENLTLFDDELLLPSFGFTKTPRYLADVKSMLELLDLKIKSQRSKTLQDAA